MGNKAEKRKGGINRAQERDALRRTQIQQAAAQPKPEVVREAAPSILRQVKTIKDEAKRRGLRENTTEINLWLPYGNTYAPFSGPTQIEGNPNTGDLALQKLSLTRHLMKNTKNPVLKSAIKDLDQLVEANMVSFDVYNQIGLGVENNLFMAVSDEIVDDELRYKMYFCQPRDNWFNLYSFCGS